MIIKDYFDQHKSIVMLRFTSPEEVGDYSCSNFVIDDKLYLLNKSGKVDYIIRLDTKIDPIDDISFIMYNNFDPHPITVEVFFGGSNSVV